MKAVTTITAGLGAVVAIAVLAVMQAQPDRAAPIGNALAHSDPLVAPLASPETPQALQWDMIYGDLAPQPFVVEAAAYQAQPARFVAEASSR